MKNWYENNSYPILIHEGLTLSVRGLARRLDVLADACAPHLPYGEYRLLAGEGTDRRPLQRKLLPCATILAIFRDMS